jgi:hypothetical protein
MANSSRNPNEVLRDAEQKGYSRILFQQGKPVCDFELTLLGDLANSQRIAAPYIGSGVPTGSDGFAIGDLNITNSNFTIKAGRCLVNGSEVVLAENTTYRTQPHGERARRFPAARTNVYLRIFPTEITDREDENLKNKGDVGTVTAVREKTDWEVLLMEATSTRPDHFLLASFNAAGGSDAVGSLIDRRRKGLTMASLRDEFDALGGSGASLNERLNVSLNPNGTLKSNIVGNAQIADGAVTLNKIADGAVTDKKIADGTVSGAKLAVNAVSEKNLADNSVLSRTIQEGAISIAKFASKSTLDIEIKVPRATMVSATNPTVVPGEVIIGIQNGDEHVFLMISVRVINPKTAPEGEPADNGVRWLQRSAWISSQGNQIHQHQLILQNFNPKIVFTVACKAYRIAEDSKER